MKKTIFLISFILVCFSACSNMNPAEKVISSQKENDLIRVHDVHYLADLIEKYYKRVGHYPLITENRDRVDVLITYKTVQYPAPTLPVRKFIRAMKEEFGKELKIPMDPEEIDPWGGVRCYTYAAVKDNYWVAAYLFNATPMTREVSEYSHKYEVGSISVPEKNIHRFKDLNHKNVDGQ